MMLSETEFEVVRIELEIRARNASRRQLAKQAQALAKADGERIESRGFLPRLAGALGLL
jgi:hypothetical protein